MEHEIIATILLMYKTRRSINDTHEEIVVRGCWMTGSHNDRHMA